MRIYHKLARVVGLHCKRYQESIEQILLVDSQHILGTTFIL